MIQFPDYTCLPTPHVLYRPHKKGNRDFFDNLALSKTGKARITRSDSTHSDYPPNRFANDEYSCGKHR